MYFTLVYFTELWLILTTGETVLPELAFGLSYISILLCCLSDYDYGPVMGYRAKAVVNASDTQSDNPGSIPHGAAHRPSNRPSGVDKLVAISGQWVTAVE